MNFGTVVECHNGRKISKNRMWEIFVTLKKFFKFFEFDSKYRRNIAPKTFWRFFAKTTTSRGEEKYSGKPEPEVVFVAS